MGWDDLYIDTPDQSAESLALALIGIARARGATLAYADAAMALGCPFMLCGERNTTDMSTWTVVGRDVGLMEAAAAFGMHLRPIHPRSAAMELSKSPEYALHFRDSYAPLIIRALAHDQVVIVWGGWPEPSAHDWGVVTEFDAVLNEIRGVVVKAHGRVKLAAPPLQCYVVEEYEPRTPTPVEIFNCATTAYRRMLDECAESPTMVAGADAIRAWRDRIEHPIAAERWAGRKRLRAVLLANRLSGVNWLRDNVSYIPGVDEITDLLDRSIAAMELMPPGHEYNTSRALSDAMAVEARLPAAVAKYVENLGSKTPA